MTHVSAERAQRIVDCWRQTGSAALTARAYGVSEATVRALARMWCAECADSPAADVQRAA